MSSRGQSVDRVYVDEASPVTEEQLRNVIDTFQQYQRNGSTPNVMVMHPEAASVFQEALREHEDAIVKDVHEEWKEEPTTEKVDRPGAFDIFQGIH